MGTFSSSYLSFSPIYKISDKRKGTEHGQNWHEMREGHALATKTPCVTPGAKCSKSYRKSGEDKRLQCGWRNVDTAQDALTRRMLQRPYEEEAFIVLTYGWRSWVWQSLRMWPQTTAPVRKEGSSLAQDALGVMNSCSLLLEIARASKK